MIIQERLRMIAKDYERSRTIMNVERSRRFVKVQMKVHEKERREVMNDRYCSILY